METDVSDTKFVVYWTTMDKVNGSIVYGTNTLNLNQNAEDVRGDVVDDTHYVTVSGLIPNTVYYYDIISGGVNYNNSGLHYNVTTGPTLALSLPKTIYGKV